MGLFVRVVIRKAITSLAGHELAAFTDGQYSTEAGQTANPVSVIRLQIRYLVQRTGLQDDYFENTLHFVNTAGELPGAPATDTQKAAAESAYGAFWSAIKARANNQTGLSEYRWYRFTFDDPISGPPTRVTPVTRTAGTTANQMASQMAETITMRTALRKHWGRVYFPGAPISTDGLISTTDVDAFANGWKSFLNGCVAAGLVPVVYSPTKQAVFSIMAIESDNVADVVRRRRPKASTYKKILTS